MPFCNKSVFLVSLLNFVVSCFAWIPPYYQHPCGDIYTLTTQSPAARFFFNYYRWYDGREQLSCDIKVTSEPGTHIGVRVRLSYMAVQTRYIDCRFHSCTCRQLVYVNITDSDGFDSYTCVSDSPRDDVLTSRNGVDIHVAYKTYGVTTAFGIVFQFRTGKCRSTENRCKNSGICIHYKLFNDRDINYCNVEGFLNHSSNIMPTTNNGENNSNSHNNSSNGTTNLTFILLFCLGVLLFIVTCMCCCCYCCPRKEANRQREMVDSNTTSVYCVAGALPEVQIENIENMFSGPPAYDTLEEVDKPPSYEDAVM